MADIYGKGAKGKATRLHALLVRQRGSCENCGTTNALQCDHIISRKYGRTRTKLENAFCLCASCHMRFTDNPVEFGQFTISKIGDEAYANLIIERNKIDKVDWEEELCRLQTLMENQELLDGM